MEPGLPPANEHCRRRTPCLLPIGDLIRYVRRAIKDARGEKSSEPVRSCSLDLDPLPVQNPNNNGDEKQTFSGKRVKRGLYRTSDGLMINADINGSGNIIRKVAPNA